MAVITDLYDEWLEFLTAPPVKKPKIVELSIGDSTKIHTYKTPATTQKVLQPRKVSNNTHGETKKGQSESIVKQEVGALMTPSARVEKDSNHPIKPTTLTEKDNSHLVATSTTTGKSAIVQQAPRQQPTNANQKPRLMTRTSRYDSDSSDSDSDEEDEWANLHPNVRLRLSTCSLTSSIH